MPRTKKSNSNPNSNSNSNSSTRPSSKKNNWPEKKKKLRRIWSKNDVVSIMKGIVDYIALKRLDPAINLGDFVKFMNKNPNYVPKHVFDKVTWQLREVSDGVIDYVLRLESNNSGKSGGVVSLSNVGGGGSEKGFNLGEICGGVRVSVPSVWNSGKKAKMGKNGGVLSLGKSGGGVRVSSVENLGKKVKMGKNGGGVRVSSVGNCGKKAKMGKNGGVLSLGKNGGGVRVRVSSVENLGKKAKSGKNGGGVRVSSVWNCGKKAILGANDVGDTKNVVKNKKGGRWMSSIVRRVKNQKRSCVVKAGSKSKVGASKNMVEKKWENKRKKTMKENGLKSKKRKLATTLVKDCGQNSIVVVAKEGGLMNDTDGWCQKKRRIDKGCTSSGVGFWQRNEGILRELQSNVSWCAPKLGVLKWNTDASLREDRSAAIGGVLRDYLGSFWCVFSCPVNCSDINEAEVTAIYKALELASCNALLSSNMVVESDSMTAVRWCNEDGGGPPNLSYMLNFIRVCRMIWQGLEITYMGRKSNTVADHLAKQGHDQSVDYVAWMM
ncbi:hypothetical protein vseg_017416 [Gypsophila vaccaria]